MKSDIQIAQEAQMIHIKEVAQTIGIQEDELEFYGKYKDFCMQISRAFYTKNM